MIVRLLLQAEEDLDAITEPLRSEILERLNVLKRYPELGHPMDGPYTGYRLTVAGLFRIVYRLKSEHMIEIAYIRHARRHLS